MEETGVVLSIEDGEAMVRFERTEACKKCGACKLGQDGEMLLKVNNAIGAKQGDRVSVSLRESQLLTASLLAYGLPLAGLVAGLAAGSLVSQYLPDLNSDIVMVIGAALFTGAAFLINRLLEPSRRKRQKYQPVPTKVLGERQEDTTHGK